MSKFGNLKRKKKLTKMFQLQSNINITFFSEQGKP